MKKNQTFDLSYFSGKNHFENDKMQNSLGFQPLFTYFKTPIANSNQIIEWKSNGLPEQSITSPTTSNNYLALGMTFFNGAKIKEKFYGGCLKQDKITFHHKNSICVSCLRNKFMAN